MEIIKISVHERENVGKKTTKGLLKFKIENVFFVMFYNNKNFVCFAQEIYFKLILDEFKNKEKIKHSILQLVMVTDRNGKKRAGNFFFVVEKFQLK